MRFPITRLPSIGQDHETIACLMSLSASLTWTRDPGVQIKSYVDGTVSLVIEPVGTARGSSRTIAAEVALMKQPGVSPRSISLSSGLPTMTVQLMIYDRVQTGRIGHLDRFISCICSSKTPFRKLVQ